MHFDAVAENQNLPVPCLRSLLLSSACWGQTMLIRSQRFHLGCLFVLKPLQVWRTVELVKLIWSSFKFSRYRLFCLFFLGNNPNSYVHMKPTNQSVNVFLTTKCQKLAMYDSISVKWSELSMQNWRDIEGKIFSDIPDVGIQLDTFPYT
jgi:hypothetical protein